MSHNEAVGKYQWVWVSNEQIFREKKKRISWARWARWLHNGVTTPIKNVRRFLTPLVCAGCLLTGWEAAFSRAERGRTPPDLHEQAASNPASRQSAQTSGVRKRLPFSPCIRSEVTPPVTLILSNQLPFKIGQSQTEKPFWVSQYLTVTVI